MRIQVIFGILWIFTQAAMGFLFEEPVVCQLCSQCYVALGQRLHLQMPQEDAFTLKITDRTSTTQPILKYRTTKSNQPTPKDPRWQFFNDNKTMILTSAARRDSGTYILETNDENGNVKSSYNLQLIIEAEVSSVKVSSSCLASGVMKVNCSANGDNLRFSWTPELNPELQLINRNSALILDRDHQGEITCHVENHVSHDHVTTGLHSCSGFMVFVSVWLFEVIILKSLLVGAFYIYTRIYRKLRTPDNLEVL